MKRWMVSAGPGLRFEFRLTYLDPTFLAGHAAAIKLNLGGKNHTIGVFGILHPSVLQKFELP